MDLSPTLKFKIERLLSKEMSIHFGYMDDRIIKLPDDLIETLASEVVDTVKLHIEDRLKLE